MNSRTQARIAELVAELNKCIEEYYQVDDKVLVSDDGVTWYNRYFAKFGVGGMMQTYPAGATSWSYTQGQTLTKWKHYRKFL